MNNSNLKFFYRSCVLIATLCLFASNSAFARKLDSSICDKLEFGGTPGLYGLCIAYQQTSGGACDSPELKPAAKKILENYNERKSESDPEMPCEATEAPCPCWADTAELVSIVESGQAHLDDVANCPDFVSNWPFSRPMRYVTTSLGEYIITGDSLYNNDIGDISNHAFVVSLSIDRCIVSKSTCGGGFIDISQTRLDDDPATQAIKFDACLNQLNQVVNDLGL